MTSHNVPQGANAIARLMEPTGITVRAEVSRPRRHRDGWQFELSPLDRSRTGRLSAFMSDGFARQIEDASGMLFHAEDLLGQHEVMLTVSMDALLGLTARIIGLDRGILVEAWNRQDAALEAALIEEGVWQAQRALPRPQRLRRLLMIAPDAGATTGAISGILSRWAEQALAALEETMHEHLAAEARRALLRVMAAYEDAVRLCLTHAEQQLLKLGLTIERSLLASIASRSEVVVATEMTAGGVGGNERPPDPHAPQDPLTEAVLAMVIEAETGLVMQSAVDARRASRLILQFPDGLMGVWNHPKTITTH